MTTGKVMMWTIVLCLVTWALTAGISSPQRFSQVLSFQGRLCGTDGKPLPDGPYIVQFAMYSVETGGTALWTESQGVTQVGGVFVAYLGSATPFPADLFTGGDRWLGIAVDPENNPEMPQRFRLTPAPWAIRAAEADRAGVADQAANADKVDNLHASATPTPNYLMALGPDGKFPAEVIPGGAGLTLPYDGSGTSADPLFKVTNLGTGDAMYGQNDSSGLYGALGGRWSGVLGSDATGDNQGGIGSSGSAVWGESESGIGVWGGSWGSGVYGVEGVTEGPGVGVYGHNQGGFAHGYLGGLDYGVRGVTETAAGYGVFGEAQHADGTAVYGLHSASGNYGFLGRTDSGVYGKHGTSGCFGALGSADLGAQGTHPGTGNWGALGLGWCGVRGEAFSVDGIGVHASSWGAGGRGVLGDADGTGMAVYGRHVSSNGYGYLAGPDCAVFGHHDTGYAGYFEGNVKMDGDVQATGDLHVSGDLSVDGAFALPTPVLLTGSEWYDPILTVTNEDGGGAIEAVATAGVMLSPAVRATFLQSDQTQRTYVDLGGAYNAVSGTNALSGCTGGLGLMEDGAFGYGRYGVTGRSETLAGRFECLPSGQNKGYAYLGYGNRGIEAQGSELGGYFKDRNSSGYAYVGYGDRGIEAQGNEAGGYFRDTDGAGYAFVGYGDEGVSAFGEYGVHGEGQYSGGYFANTYCPYSVAYLGFGNTGIHAEGDAAGGTFYNGASFSSAELATETVGVLGVCASYDGSGVVAQNLSSGRQARLATADHGAEFTGSVLVDGDVHAKYGDEDHYRPVLPPIAYATVSKAGDKVFGTNNISITRKQHGYYNIQISGEDFDQEGFWRYIVIVTPCDYATNFESYPVYAGVYRDSDYNQIRVLLHQETEEGRVTLCDYSFAIVVFKVW
jgi:hypothetical protein